MEHRSTAWRALAQSVVRFLQSEDGPTAVEYAVMLSRIITVCITAIQALGTKANSTFNAVGSQLGKAAGS